MILSKQTQIQPKNTLTLSRRVNEFILVELALHCQSTGGQFECFTQGSMFLALVNSEVLLRTRTKKGSESMYLALLLHTHPGQLMQKKFQARFFSQIPVSLGALSMTFHDKCTKMYSQCLKKRSESFLYAAVKILSSSTIREW